MDGLQRLLSGSRVLDNGQGEDIDTVFTIDFFCYLRHVCPTVGPQLGTFPRFLKGPIVNGVEGSSYSICLRWALITLFDTSNN